MTEKGMEEEQRRHRKGVTGRLTENETEKETKKEREK